MRHHRTKRRALKFVTLALSGATVFQISGCINSLIPSLVATIEQQVFSTIFTQLLPL